VVVGLQHGDEGKGKVINYLTENNTYQVGVRFGGGPNAGHTFYKNGQKIATHHIPVSIAGDIVCLIGPTCVIDLTKLEKEITYLENIGINVRNRLRLSYNCHIITPEAIQDDINSNKVGTTNCGIGPTYSRKMLRTGKRVVDFLEKRFTSDDIVFEQGVVGEVLGCQVVDSYIYLNFLEKSYQNKGEVLRILFEGAQGFNLDINWGDYPYVTSSSCLTYQIFSTGVPIKSIHNVYGIAKMYDTYVGSKEFMPPNHESLLKLQKEGNEYGTTTGRARQCNWLNLQSLRKALGINCINTLIINKCDIVDTCGVFKLYDNQGKLQTFQTSVQMRLFIQDALKDLNIDDIIYSYSPETV
jgi:adenylosuccinate synthase